MLTLSAARSATCLDSITPCLWQIIRAFASGGTGAVLSSGSSLHQQQQTTTQHALLQLRHIDLQQQLSQLVQQQRACSPFITQASQSHLQRHMCHGSVASSTHSSSRAFSSYSASTSSGCSSLGTAHPLLAPQSPAWLTPAAPLLGLAVHHQPYQLQHRRGVRQLIPHALAPKPLPRFRKPSKDGRMNRMVIRIPPQVQMELKDQALTLTGKAGSTSLKLPFLDPTGLVAWQCYTQSMAAAAAGPGTGSLLLLASPSRRCWRGIQTHINNAVHGVTQGYLVGVTVQGVGYRLEPVPDSTIVAALEARRGSSEEGDSSSSSKRRIIWEQEAEKTNIVYPHKQPAKAVRLKVGYTRACIFRLPEGVLAFFVKPTLMYLYGIDKALVNNTAAAIRAVRKPNAYTGNGVQLVGEVIKQKQRAGSK